MRFADLGPIGALFRVKHQDVSALERANRDRADFEHGRPKTGQPELPLRHPKYLRLGLKLIPLICLLVVGFTALHFAYDYAQERVAQRQVANQTLKSLNPLYYEGQPMVREWARKAIKDLAYARGWYECIGEGEVIVLMWTIWFLL
jgi:hypothetical protein